eukprot:scaffold555686_cov14-Prasinocladus_malaysianus.AAC.1
MEASYSDLLDGRSQCRGSSSQVLNRHVIGQRQPQPITWSFFSMKEWQRKGAELMVAWMGQQRCATQRHHLNFGRR